MAAFTSTPKKFLACEVCTKAIKTEHLRLVCPTTLTEDGEASNALTLVEAVDNMDVTLQGQAGDIRIVVYCSGSGEVDINEGQVQLLEPGQSATFVHACDQWVVLNQPIPVMPFLSASQQVAQIVPANTPIMWDTVHEDAADMLSAGLITLPNDGIYEVEAHVSIQQSGMTNFPASFYQHILVLSKSTPFPEGLAWRFISFYQDRFAAPALEKQVSMNAIETFRAAAGETVSLQLSTTTFAPVFGTVSTQIAGVAGLNNFTLRQVV